MNKLWIIGFVILILILSGCIESPSKPPEKIEIIRKNSVLPSTPETSTAPNTIPTTNEPPTTTSSTTTSTTPPSTTHTITITTITTIPPTSITPSTSISTTTSTTLPEPHGTIEITTVKTDWTQLGDVGFGSISEIEIKVKNLGQINIEPRFDVTITKEGSLVGAFPDADNFIDMLIPDEYQSDVLLVPFFIEEPGIYIIKVDLRLKAEPHIIDSASKEVTTG